MFERFTREARAAVVAAEEEARVAGSRTVEAEHLLLAACGAVGLERAALVEALDEEWRASLDAAGVGLSPPGARRYAGRVRFGTSAKAALERALRIAVERRDRRIGARHVALGALGARHGTVPRAVERAGLAWRA